MTSTTYDYAYQLDRPQACWEDELPAMTTQVLGDKYQKSGTATPVAWLDQVLTEKWETDVHFTMYHGPNMRCLKPWANRYDFHFDFVAYDLDFQDHEARPTADDWNNLQRTLYVLEEITPNIAYQTRGGARIIYVIESVTDVEWFESHYAAFMEIVADLLTRVECPYKLDTSTKDWTRLFRSARTVREGVEEYHHDIRVFHHGKLNLDGFQPKRKPTRKPVMPRASYGRDSELERRLGRMVHHQRNRTTYSCARYCLDHYTGAALEGALDRVRAVASAAGLEDKEIDDTFRSARKGTR